MRDLLNILDQVLTEAPNLAPSEFTNRPGRFEKFIEKIQNQQPFLTVKGELVVIDPSMAQLFLSLAQEKKFVGSLSAKLLPGQSQDSIPLSQLAKTTDLGGATPMPSKDGQPGAATADTKEGLIIKPSQIDICDREIPAENLYEIIAGNPALSATDYGKVVQNLANYIVSGEYVVLPDEYNQKSKEKVRKAIVDYAGEYLGVLALVYGRSAFSNKDQFIEWLGGDLGQLTVNFPKKANTNLADSFASITNPNTSHTLNISSKGTGGGAAPAISGLKISDEIANDPNLANAVNFIKICQASDKSGGPTTITQAFAAMDLIYEVSPESLPKKFLKYLPFSSKSPDLMARCVKMISEKDIVSSLPTKYNDLFKDVDSARATDGGKAVYAIKIAVADAINNNNAIPEFRDTILTILEMNFIQQYTDYNNGELTFETLWPAKLHGVITVENKSSAVSPTDGGFSFKIGRPDHTDADGGDAEAPEESPTAKPSAITGKPIRGIRPKSAPSSSPEKGVGRERR